MKTEYDVLDLLFPVVNVAAVRATIDGAVYRGNRPVNSTTRDITLKVLTMTGGHDIDLQRCTVMINAFAPDLQAGRQDDKNLGAMTTAIITVLESYASATKYFDVEISGHNTFEDIDQTGIHYSSLRTECTIQFKT